MTTEDGAAFQAAQAADNDPVLSAGLEIAMKWGTALGGPGTLDVALKALEPQLRREHKERMMRLEMQREAVQREAQWRREERGHQRYIAGLVVGAVIAVAMLAAGLYVAHDSWWLSALLCGPSLLALVKVFVLRRSDAGDMLAVSGSARESTRAASQAQPPAV